MVRSKILVALLAVICLQSWTMREAPAQRFYDGSGSTDAQYFGRGGIDSNGRADYAEGRLIDRYGYPIDDYGRATGNYALPSHSASGSYYPGGYSGLGYSNGIGYSIGLGGYSGGYYSSGGRFGTGVGVTYISPPRTIVVGGAYPSRTVMNNATRGGVVEYTNNGNGYVYTPGTSSQTVVSSGPSIFPSTTVVQPSQPPVIIRTQPLQTTSKTFSGSSNSRTSNLNGARNDNEIKLICPKESPAPVVYLLNGTSYSIKPGYSQTFSEDRVWTIEFLRGGSGSQPVRYDLRAGTYQFAADESGWDLKQFPLIAAPELPPSPAPLSPPAPAPTPSPDL